MNLTDAQKARIRASARDERCTVQFPSIAYHDPATVILAHLPDESHGMGKKSFDLSSCYACMGCHDILDGRADPAKNGLTEADMEFFMRRAQTRTLRRLLEKGVLVIK